MDVFLLNLINGISLGAMYALVALGLSLIFGVARLVNFAHGDLFMLSGYLLVWLYTINHLPYWLAVVLTIVGMAVFGILFERVVIRPVLEQSWRVQLIATLAASIFLSSFAILAWGTTPQEAPTHLSREILRLGPVNIAYQRIILVAAALLAFAALSQFIHRSKIGKAMRAIAQNREACIVYGIDVQKVSAVTVSIGAGLAALAAGLITPLYNVWPAVGSLLTLKALAAVVMGGLGETTGAIYAAFILGISEALFGGYISYEYRDVCAFVVLIFVLLYRPQGIFGKKVGT